MKMKTWKIMRDADGKMSTYESGNQVKLVNNEDSTYIMFGGNEMFFQAGLVQELLNNHEKIRSNVLNKKEASE